MPPPVDSSIRRIAKPARCEQSMSTLVNGFAIAVAVMLGAIVPRVGNVDR